MRNIQRTLTLVLALALGNAICAQLKTGTYLVGTQGFLNGRAYDGFNSIQVLDPYSGRAKVLDVRGIPDGELAADFILASSSSFYVGTKVASAPAEGNLYLVRFIADAWQASKVNTSNLGINVGSLVADDQYFYITGVDSFASTSTVAQVLRVRRSDGAVDTLSRFGAAFMSGGAVGIPGGMQLIDGRLHIFTFNGSAAVTDAEHWTVTTSTPAVAAKIGSDLPMSQRFPGRGFAASDSVYDPRSGKIVVVGRWGELLFRDPETGENTGYERYPGLRSPAVPDFRSEQPRAATLNTDTWAIAFGDHRNHAFGTAGIDERRFDGASPDNPFSRDVVMTRQPKPKGDLKVTTISALAYLGSGALFHPFGQGCRASNGAVPGSYVSQPPRAGTGRFELTVETDATLAILNVGSRIQIDLTGLGAPGCFDLVEAGVLVPVTVTGGVARHRMVLPANVPTGTTMFVQWQVPDAAANTLGMVFSAGRKLVVR